MVLRGAVRLRSYKSDKKFFYADDKDKGNNTQYLMSMRFDILGGNLDSAGEASSTIKSKLKQLGIGYSTVRRVSIASYETEMNIVLHADRGTLSVYVAKDHIKIIAEDEGPGIKNVELAMQEGYSTATDKIREMGFGAGMGLPNMKKCSDQFEIHSDIGKGTKVKIVIYF